MSTYCRRLWNDRHLPYQDVSSRTRPQRRKRLYWDSQDQLQLNCHKSKKDFFPAAFSMSCRHHRFSTSGLHLEKDRLYSDLKRCVRCPEDAVPPRRRFFPAEIPAETVSAELAIDWSRHAQVERRLKPAI